MSTASPQDGTLSPALREQIQGAYRAWLAARGFTPRRGQRLMIAEIARTLGALTVDELGMRESGPPHVVVAEAGTGTGKTLAYGLAAIPLAQARGLTLVISTATVALQDQLVERDLPDLRGAAGLKFTYALAKGRGRYACLARLDRILSDDGVALASDLFGPPPSLAARPLYQAMQGALEGGRWDGDRERYGEAIDDDRWASVTTDHRGCTGSRCTFFRDCPYFKAREAVQRADVIVANHDLILADLALGGGVVLPTPEETIYVFDEGHHLSEKALGHLRRFTRILGSQQTLDAFERLVGTLAQRLGRAPAWVAAAQRLAQLGAPLRETLSATLTLADQLEALEEGAPGLRRGQAPAHRFPHGDVGESWRTQGKQLAEAFAELVSLGDELGERLSEALEQAGDARAELEAAQGSLGQLQGRLEGSEALWRDFAQASDAPHARWISRLGQEGSLDVEVQSSPLSAGTSLRSVLWDRCFGAVVSSATLSSTDGFGRFAEAAGVPDNARYLVVPSSFAYEEVAQLVVPKLRSDPSQSEAHAGEIAELLPGLIREDEGTLVIFTSWRQLDQVCAALPPALLKRVLSQATESKGRILAEHQRRIDGGEGSVIFGLASFAEGIDLPGAYCRHVIICKLPFSVPDDPVEAATAEWLSAQQRNPFMEMSVPDAALRLKQACGRLLRSEKDYGRITLLDKRIVTRRYGQAILDALPPFERVFEA
ncbi:MAG: ATP-dependent DNA helicase DinG [Pseudomonadales bacterium]